MEGYKVTIKWSSKELSARERIILKDTSNATKLDTVANGANEVVITVDQYAVLSIHNEKSDNKDYENYIIVDTDGNKYVTGSPSFWDAFSDIMDEMSGEEEKPTISVYKMDSKNYKGKQFLTCSLI